MDCITCGRQMTIKVTRRVSYCTNCGTAVKTSLWGTRRHYTVFGRLTDFARDSTISSLTKELDRERMKYSELHEAVTGEIIGAHDLAVEEAKENSRVASITCAKIRDWMDEEGRT